MVAGRDIEGIIAEEEEGMRVGANFVRPLDRSCQVPKLNSQSGTGQVTEPRKLPRSGAFGQDYA